MNAISNIYMRAFPETQTSVHPLKTVVPAQGDQTAAPISIEWIFRWRIPEALRSRPRRWGWHFHLHGTSKPANG
jgi:hypothetical protein